MLKLVAMSYTDMFCLQRDHTLTNRILARLRLRSSRSILVPVHLMAEPTQDAERAGLIAELLRACDEGVLDSTRQGFVRAMPGSRGARKVAWVSLPCSYDPGSSMTRRIARFLSSALPTTSSTHGVARTIGLVATKAGHTIEHHFVTRPDESDVSITCAARRCFRYESADVKIQVSVLVRT
jgi:hypothetical protein